MRNRHLIQNLQSKQKQNIQRNLNTLPSETVWMEELFVWADNYKISLEKFPRDKHSLWAKTVLNLDNCGLKEIPHQIGKLTNLHVLGMINNHLEDLPESLSNLKKLKIIFLEGNHLKEIPKVIFEIKSLVSMGVKKNMIVNVPNEISNLSLLSELYLEDNYINELPESIGSLTNLKKLYLQNNKLIKLPNSISNLKILEELALYNNKLTDIPESIIELKKLKVLSIEKNEIRDIPKSIKEIKKLSIYSDENPLEKIVEYSHKMGMQKEDTKNDINKSTKKIKNDMKTYQQKIIFGSPGTGKSHKISTDILPNYLSIHRTENIIKTVFHPEYTYGDFVGKLVPITRKGAVEYNFYEGHFLKALSQAYKNIISAHEKTEETQNVALVIDEINRGNSAAIFGTIFQLLDRETDGWSSYEVSINEITFNRLFELCDLKIHSHVTGTDKVSTYKLGEEEILASNLQTRLDFLGCNFENRTIKIPPNLSILASMNTSDSSIYYMDSAFKRRWEWEFIDVNSNSILADGVAFENRENWINFVHKLNIFIKSNHKYIRGIEDKQIGHFFITDEKISKASIQNKLMFFLWDSVFNRDKKPLIKLLFDDKDETLITFGDFAKEVDLFIQKINDFNV